MYFDILIFAAVAAFLVYRLMSVLGTRHGGERQRDNPFTAAEPAQRRDDAGVIVDVEAKPFTPRTLVTEGMIDEALNKDGRIETGLAEIASADARFDLPGFMRGARAAFELIVTSYTRGDLETLRPLLSPKLFADFSAGVKAREAAGHRAEITIHRITKAHVTEAHLGGTMAYVTVDFDVEETTVTRDEGGNVVDGNPDRIFSVEDIWTFSRDTRASNPNWTLIETRSVEK